MSAKSNAAGRKIAQEADDNYMGKVTLCVIVVALATIALAYHWSKTHSSHTKTEAYLRSLPVDVTAGFEPAVVYFEQPGTTNNSFICFSGTLYRSTNNQVRLLTAEHVFTTSIPGNRVVRVEAVNRLMNPRVMYVTKILATGQDLGGSDREGRDIVVALLGTNAVPMQPYSNFGRGETIQNLWGKVRVGDTAVPRIRSLSSGEYVNTLGYALSVGAIDRPKFVVVGYSADPKERGAGFIDDFGGVWTLHDGVYDKSVENQICEEASRVLGKKVRGISTVSGPIFGRYDQTITQPTKTHLTTR